MHDHLFQTVGSKPNVGTDFGTDMVTVVYARDPLTNNIFTQIIRVLPAALKFFSKMLSDDRTCRYERDRTVLKTVNSEFVNVHISI